MNQLKVSQVVLILVMVSGITFGFKKIGDAIVDKLEPKKIVVPVFPGHKYSLTGTEEFWGAKLQHYQNALLIMRQSTVPGNQIASASDSLIKDMQDIQTQIGQQLAADTLKPKK